MKKAVQLLICLLFPVLLGNALAQSATGETQSPNSEQEQQEIKPVTAVYGVTADDYLPSTEYTAADYLQPKTRKSASHPRFDLPDAFYFIGGPVFC